MQALCKLEQPSKLPFSIKPSSLDVIMTNIINEMEKGKESLQMIRSISLQRPRFKVEDGHDDDDDDICKALNHHSMVALTSYRTSLLMLRSYDFTRKRKIHHLEENDSLDNDYKYDRSSSMDLPKDTTSRRGRYKRSGAGEARVEEVMQLRDDGFGWRKYGQKTILNSKHPRNYYRCTHKFEQKCVATKQVQQISENPTKYMIYHGNHTCNNILKANPIIIDPQEQHSSAVLLCFDLPHQFNPVLFPTPTFTELKPVKEEKMAPLSPSLSLSHDSYSFHNKLLSPSSENVSTGISSTPVSEQSDMISTAENFSSNVSQDDIDGEEDYSHMWAELAAIQDLDPC